jgi:MFS family permease
VESVSVIVDGRAPGHHRSTAVFWRYWAASTISAVGDAISRVALPLTAVLALHATSLQVSLLAAAQYAAWIVLGLPAGVIVGRFPLRRTQIAMDTIRCAAVGSVPLSAALGELAVVQLVVVALVLGVSTVIFDVANATLLPSLVRRERLTARNSLMSASAAITDLAGPFLGGLLVQIVGAARSLLADAASYLCSAVLLAALPRRGGAAAEQAEVSIRESMAAGVRFVFEHPLMRPCVVLATVINFSCGAVMALTPVFLVRTLHCRPALVGLLVAAEGLGGLIGAALTPRLQSRFGSARAVLAAALALPLALTLMPLASPGPGLLLFAFGNAGFALCTVITSILARTHRHAVTPAELLPRVMATVRFISWGIVPVGALSAGIAATILGARTALALIAVTAVAAPIATWSSDLRKHRELA